MAKLYFKYGTMGSGKTLEILRAAYNYIERGQDVLLLTSALDNRFGSNTKIKSRVGLEMDAIPIYDDTNIINDIFCKILKEKEIKCVFVDEAQFLKRYHIDNLLDIVDYYKVPVICYGLNSDYKNNPFEGSSHLMAVADVIEEIKSICWCGKKATTNARIIDNKIIKDGDQILIGGNESYISLCRYHFKEGKINGN
jgi:thymidine kinase